MAEPTRCPHCRKAVPDANALFQHVKAKHGPASARVFRQPRESNSVASELVDALQSGERPAHRVDMLPESFHADLR